MLSRLMLRLTNFIFCLTNKMDEFVSYWKLHLLEAMKLPTVEDVARAEEAKEKIGKLGETVGKGIDRLGKGVGESIEKLEDRVGKEKDRLKKTFEETKEKAGNKIRESLGKLLPGQE